MKNEDREKDQEMEKLLKNKMQELSASVDCFDKISEKAFSGKASDFTEGGYTVNDLEKITSERKKHPVFKWAAVAAAVIVIIGILPKTAQVNRQNSEREATNVNLQTYKTITDKINSIEKAHEDYTTYDMPLNRWLENDILTDPLFTCPFEANNKEDVKVRYYIRNCGSYHTNEVYAVEYSGEFSPENYIAAASSGVSFTDEELSGISAGSSADPFTVLMDAYDLHSDVSVSAAFRSDGSSITTAESGESVYLASFAYPTYYKLESGEIIPLVTDIEYYQLPESGEYSCSAYYISSGYSHDELEENYIHGWKDAVYHSGKLSIPNASSRRYQKTECNDSVAGKGIISISPLRSAGMQHANDIKVFDNSGSLISYVDLPSEQNARSSAKIYLPDDILAQYSSSVDLAILRDSNLSYSVIIKLSDIHIPEAIEH